MGKKLILLGMCCTLFGSLTCFDLASEVLRQARLPDDATPGTCFELTIRDNLLEIPCSVF